MDKNDESMHPAGEDRAWSESYYFNFVDPDKKIGMFTRMGFRVNEGWADGLHVLFLGGDRLAFNYGRRELQRGDESLQVGGLGLELLEPFRRWIIRYNGPAQDIPDGSILMIRSKERPEGWHRLAELEMGLEFEAQTDPFYDFTGARGHFEQTGAASGNIRLGPESWTVKGWGVRDKSWGPRDWKPGTGPSMARMEESDGRPAPFVTWFSANFGQDMALGCSCFRQSDGTVRGSGWFQCEGKNQPLLDIVVESEYRRDSILHSALRLTGRTEDGRTRSVTGQVLTICPTKIAMPDGATFINEGLTQFSLEGQEGYGIAEYWNSVQK
jgi:hypothetical protein